MNTPHSREIIRSNPAWGPLQNEEFAPFYDFPPLKLLNSSHSMRQPLESRANIREEWLAKTFLAPQAKSAPIAAIFVRSIAAKELENATASMDEMDG